MPSEWKNGPGEIEKNFHWVKNAGLRRQEPTPRRECWYSNCEQSETNS